MPLTQVLYSIQHHESLWGYMINWTWPRFHMGLAERRLMQCGKKHVPASPWGNKGLRIRVSVVDD